MPQTRPKIIRLTDGSSIMKKLVLAALLASFTFGASAAEKINFGVSATYPPFESIGANNEIVGFDIDLAKALCKQMQAECTFTNHAFDSLIPSLKFRKYDAVISGMDITPERSKQVSFTTPYYENSAVVIAKRYLQNVCRSERQTYWDGKRHHAPEIYSGSAPGSENCLL